MFKIMKMVQFLQLKFQIFFERNLLSKSFILRGAIALIYAHCEGAIKNIINLEN